MAACMTAPSPLDGLEETTSLPVSAREPRDLSELAVNCIDKPSMTDLGGRLPSVAADVAQNRIGPKD
eukprot:scaffold620_cov386-Prasinococcus_capsulatus_cf.AAC.7